MFQTSQTTQPKPSPQKSTSTKYSLHDFTLLHILDPDLIHHRVRALTEFPQYYANQPTDYLLPVQDLLKHQSHKYMHILTMFNKHYRPNPTLFKVMTSTETAGTFSLTNLLCFPAIEYLGTPQQFLHYSRLIEEGRLVGSYAQTEIAHGSDVQSLGTEAVYDPVKKCLVFNTPSIHGIKFWPGGLGIFGTHIITQAKLIVEGQSHGLQTFIIPIRDPKTLQPLKGAIMGDLGPKLGFKGADNGYLQFDHLEAPVDTLLARFIQLDTEGKVTKSEDKNANKIAYGSMMTLRGNLLRFFSELLSKGVQMGHIHRQVSMRQPYEVRKDLDMLTHYYCFGLSSYNLTNLLKSFLASYYNDQKKALRMIPEIHFLTTGFKTLSSWKTIKSTREEASAMGLGDLLMSGVVQLYSDVVPTSTYEGDNAVLMLQVLRVLLGAYTGLMSSKTLTGSLDFLNRFQDYAVEQKEFDEVIEVTGVEDLFQVSEKILENYTFKMIQTVCKKIQKSAMEDGVPLKRVMSEGLQTELVQTALKVFEVVNYKLAMKVYEDKNTTAMLNDRDAAILGNMLQLHKFAYIKDKLNHMLEAKVVKFNEDIEEIAVQAKEIYYVDLVPELDYLYKNGFLKQVELSTVRNYKNLDHKVYLKAAGNIGEALKETQADLLKFSKL